MRAIIPATVTFAIHHMLAMKKSVPATQLQKNADFFDRVPWTTINHGTSPTHAR